MASGIADTAVTGPHRLSQLQHAPHPIAMIHYLTRFLRIWQPVVRDFRESRDDF